MPLNIENKISNVEEKLLSKSLETLLEDFGKGNATPGSGSAAALMALLASSTICALAKLTDGKRKDPEKKEELQAISKDLEEKISPNLKILFERDTEVFQRSIAAREKRDDLKKELKKLENNSGKNEFVEQKKHLINEQQNIANETLEVANNILFEIVSYSVRVFDHGCRLWSIGLTYAKGDAGAGINSSLSAVSTCLLVAHVNVQTAAKDKLAWVRDAKMKCDTIQELLSDMQERAQIVIQDSRKETMEKIIVSPRI
ncbi:cyclodeaminase/cyclohydrolase family protein [Asaia sp. BMEF1]|uniref:cyclodeaminase/cyclohydrolase family protein n=1 Tax=Asaia sp. BMEF1 TaxID=3155932 RepID=UPI003F662E78